MGRLDGGVGSGDLSLYGGAGDDRLTAHAGGRHELRGDDGNDLFVISAEAVNRLYDVSGANRIEVTDISSSDFVWRVAGEVLELININSYEVFARLEQASGFSSIKFSDGVSILVSDLMQDIYNPIPGGDDDDFVEEVRR